MFRQRRSTASSRSPSRAPSPRSTRSRPASIARRWRFARRSRRRARSSAKSCVRIVRRCATSGTRGCWRSSSASRPTRGRFNGQASPHRRHAQTFATRHHLRHHPRRRTGQVSAAVDRVEAVPAAHGQPPPSAWRRASLRRRRAAPAAPAAVRADRAADRAAADPRAAVAEAGGNGSHAKLGTGNFELRTSTPARKGKWRPRRANGRSDAD